MTYSTTVRLTAALLTALALGCGGNSSSNRGSTTAPATSSGPITSGVSVPGVPGVAGITEAFDDTTARDGSATDAVWGSGVLVPDVDGVGDGSDGAFVATGTVTLNTDRGPYQFSSVRIEPGAVVRASGSRPLVILSRGDVVIDGVIDVSGRDGAHGDPTLAVAPGGAGGPGAGAGGDGGVTQGQSGSAGGGQGGGRADGLAGGGAGHAAAGGAGDGFVINTFSAPGSTGGAAYGTSVITSLTGGSGGSGGSPVAFGTVGCSGPGGGGGGGGVLIRARRDVVLRGRIAADGGEGGGYPRGAGANRLVCAAGGGSGGTVQIQAGQDLTVVGGRITARGGRGGDGSPVRSLGLSGGNGAPGRVRLEDSDGVIAGLAATAVPLPSSVRVAQPFAGGNATLGDFVAPSGVTVLDTSNGPLHYRRFEIPSNATVLAQGPNPLEVFATEDIVIDGTLNASGEDGFNAPRTTTGAPGLGGRGGPGAYRGGTGGEGLGLGAALAGEDGAGPGGGQAGPTPNDPAAPFGGGGGGYGRPGQTGNRNQSGGTAAGGATYGDAALTNLEGGSGGAGAGGSNRKSGAGGGGGGGALRLQSAKTIRIRGIVRADGGHGGGRANTHPTVLTTPAEIQNAAGGAGGSGGAILLQAERIDLSGGTLSARGGLAGAGGIGSAGTYAAQDGEAVWSNGGRGGAGRIRLESRAGNLGAVDTTSATGFRSDHVETVRSEPASTGIYTPTLRGDSATSTWYAVGLDDPRFGPASVDGRNLGGVLIQFQGADDDGSGNPDLATQTGWHDQPSSLRAKEHVRFRVIFRANAEIDTIRLTASQ